MDLLAFAIDHEAPATIVLISGDRDFAYAASILRLRCYRVVVIAPSIIHASLKSQASRLVDWNCDILGKAEQDQSLSSKPMAKGNNPAPLPFSLWDGGAPNPHHRTRSHSSADQLKPVGFHPVTRNDAAIYYGLDLPAFRDDAENSQIQKLAADAKGLLLQSQSFPSRPSKDASLKQSNSTPTLLLPEALSPRLKPTSINNYTPRPKSSASFTSDSFFTSASEFHGDEGSLRSLPQSHCSLPADLEIDATPLSSIMRSVNVPAISTATAEHPKLVVNDALPVSSSLNQATVNEPNLEDLAQTSLGANPVILDTHSLPPEFVVLVDELQRLRREGLSQPPATLVGAGPQMNKSIYKNAGVKKLKQYISRAADAGIVSVGGPEGLEWVSLLPQWQQHMTVAALPAVSQPVDPVDSNPCSSTNSMPRVSSAGPQVHTATPTLDIAPKFRPLVNHLQELKSQGCTQTTWSIVCEGLHKKGYIAWKDAGFSKFGPYAALAEQACLVQTELVKDVPWISLHPRLHGLLEGRVAEQHSS